jgi:hypothetical protein
MKLINDDMAPYFEHQEGMQFKIRYIGEDEMTDINRACTEMVWDQKHQKTEKQNAKKSTRMILQRAIIGWRGLKRIKLHFLLEPGLKIILEGGESWDDEIQFSEEMLQFISENACSYFGLFVLRASRDAEAFAKAREAEEIENLSRTSGGRKPQTDFPSIK